MHNACRLKKSYWPLQDFVVHYWRSMQDQIICCNSKESDGHAGPDHTVTLDSISFLQSFAPFFFPFHHGEISSDFSVRYQWSRLPVDAWLEGSQASWRSADTGSPGSPHFMPTGPEMLMDDGLGTKLSWYVNLVPFKYVNLEKLSKKISMKKVLEEIIMLRSLKNVSIIIIN